MRIKEGYLLWINISAHISKNLRFTLGQRVENHFLDLLELIYQTYFSQKNNKLDKIDECIKTLDSLKFSITISWEAKAISHKQYEEVGLKLNEAGRMLGGWKNNLANIKKKNHNP